jgi:hypothetical protein
MKECPIHCELFKNVTKAAQCVNIISSQPDLFPYLGFKLSYVKVGSTWPTWFGDSKGLRIWFDFKKYFKMISFKKNWDGDLLGPLMLTYQIHNLDQTRLTFQIRNSCHGHNYNKLTQFGPFIYFLSLPFFSPI